MQIDYVKGIINQYCDTKCFYNWNLFVLTHLENALLVLNSLFILWIKLAFANQISNLFQEVLGLIEPIVQSARSGGLV